MNAREPRPKRIVNAPVMSDLSTLTAQLLAKENLSFQQADQAAQLLANEGISADEKEAFLIALAEKGETLEEVAAFGKCFRDLARNPEVDEWADRAIDVCGTGGDRAGTFNISTTVAFIVAAGGVPVFKHGNRSITSKCGSAELLADLGVPMEADAALLRSSLGELNFAFFFAPAFHPAFKAIMPVRQSLAKQGKRTVFNILGPMINPGRPAYQLLGVYSESWLPVMAGALDAMKLRNGFTVHCRLDGEGASGLDELSCAGSNRICGFGASRDRCETWESTRFGLSVARLEDLIGGDAKANRELLQLVLDNRAPTGLTDSILLNAGFAFYTAGESDSVEDGILLARDLLRAGTVKNHVAKIADFYRS